MFSPMVIRLTIGRDVIDLTNSTPEKVKEVVDKAFEFNTACKKMTTTLEEAVAAAKPAKGKTKAKNWEDDESSDDDEQLDDDQINEDEDEDEDEDN